MTIPEAAQLVIQAGAMATGGDVFVLEMGEPVRIVDLARRMIELNGLVPDKDIEIIIVGLRAGEKLSEDLVDWNEESTPAGVEGIVEVISKEREVLPEVVVRELEKLARRGDGEAMRRRVFSLLPTAVTGEGEVQAAS